MKWFHQKNDEIDVNYRGKAKTPNYLDWNKVEPNLQNWMVNELCRQAADADL